MRVRINTEHAWRWRLGLHRVREFRAASSRWHRPPRRSGACGDWTGYRTFVERFVQADGRVIDYSTPAQQTTSEGQSYGLFFALVANDRATFDRLLGWTRTNLAGNQFDAQNMRLPSWQWGRKPDGSYGVLDPNSASDSDLWIAYDLLQAGRLWHDADLHATRRSAGRADRAPGNDDAARRRPDAAARAARLHRPAA